MDFLSHQFVIQQWFSKQLYSLKESILSPYFYCYLSAFFFFFFLTKPEGYYSLPCSSLTTKGDKANHEASSQALCTVH